MKYQNLVTAFSNVSGASFVGLDTLTDVKLTGGKSNPQQGRIQKKMVGASVMCFQNKTVNGYDAMVRRRLTAEGKDPDKFVLGERAWGHRIPNMPIVVHQKPADPEPVYYVEVVFLKPGDTQYLLDGAPIAKEDVIGLPVIKVDPLSQGGLDNEVVVRSYRADSIVEVRVNGTVYN